MNTHERLDHFLARPQETIKINSPVVFISDTHRGCGDKADDFACNEKLYLKVLDRYFEMGWTLFEVGDADDIWECPDLSEIQKAHPRVFERLTGYSGKNRYHRVAGNHDRELGHPEALVLEHHGKKILIVHGFQGDFWNDNRTSVGAWFTRNVWRKLQWLGFRDPTSAQNDKNPKKHEQTKITLKAWAKSRETYLICGHTHFQETGASGFYWNCGSGVRPGMIECVELQGGTFKLNVWK